jgi:hypothetical protein
VRDAGDQRSLGEVNSAEVADRSESGLGNALPSSAVGQAAGEGRPSASGPEGGRAEAEAGESLRDRGGSGGGAKVQVSEENDVAKESGDGAELRESPRLSGGAGVANAPKEDTGAEILEETKRGESADDAADAEA